MGLGNGRKTAGKGGIDRVYKNMKYENCIYCGGPEPHACVCNPHSNPQGGANISVAAAV